MRWFFISKFRSHLIRVQNFEYRAIRQKFEVRESQNDFFKGFSSIWYWIKSIFVFNVNQIETNNSIHMKNQQIIYCSREFILN